MRCASFVPAELLLEQAQDLVVNLGLSCGCQLGVLSREQAAANANSLQALADVKHCAQAIEKSNGLADYDKLKDTALFNMVRA